MQTVGYMDGSSRSYEGTVADGEVNHWRRSSLWWLVATIIITPLVVLMPAPGLPPGNGIGRGVGPGRRQHRAARRLDAVALAVLVYFIYAIVAFRERQAGAILDGPPIRGDAQVQTWWLVVTSVIVLFLAGYGSVRLLADGAGGGQGPNPIAAPSGQATRSRSR